MTTGPANDEGDSQPFPPPLVLETLQYRRMTGNMAKSGGQRGSLTRCAQKLGSFRTQILSPSPDAEVIEKTKEDMKQDLSLYGLELSKLVLLHRNLEEQVERNREAEEERQKVIDELLQEVSTSQAEANQAQATKSCFQEYEALAKLTNQSHPQSCGQLREQIANIKEEIKTLNDEEGVMDNVLQVRSAQFQLLLQYMLDLKTSLNDADETERTASLARKKQSQQAVDLDDPKANEEDEMSVDEDEGLYGDL